MIITFLSILTMFYQDRKNISIYTNHKGKVCKNKHIFKTNIFLQIKLITYFENLEKNKNIYYH